MTSKGIVMIGYSGLCMKGLKIWQCYEEKLILFDSLRKRCLAMMDETLRRLNPLDYILKSSLRKDIQGGWHEIQSKSLLVDGRCPWLGL